jgi:hypothetical protein
MGLVRVKSARLWATPARIGIAAAVAVAVAAVGALALPNRSHAHARHASGPFATCQKLALGPRHRACYEAALLRQLDAVKKPDDALPKLDALAQADPAYLEQNCHVMMHEVGARYAHQHHVGMSNFVQYLPADDNPGCSAGFAHGLIIAAIPNLATFGGHPQRLLASCNGLPTRFQRYSCVHGLGHAFMRLSHDQLGPAITLCEQLGASVAPDCAQGAYHDYWFAVQGYAGATLTGQPAQSPRALCASARPDMVTVCWYRSAIQLHDPSFIADTPQKIERPCGGLSAVQHQACVTASSAIGPWNPLAQTRLCTAVPAADQLSCLRGIHTQVLMGATFGPDQLRLIERCDWFTGATRHGCTQWLATTLAVITDGSFARTGCSQLPDAPDQADCRIGAARMNGPLETFS